MPLRRRARAAGYRLDLPCENPQPPVLCGLVPGQTITVGESVTVQMCFDDPNGEMLDHMVVRSDPAMPTVVPTGSTVTVTAVFRASPL